MKTLMKLVIVLAIAGSNVLRADDGGSQSESGQLIPFLGDTSPSMRVITQREFEGIDPISIKVNQQLIIPIHYQRHIASNNVTILFGPIESNIISVIGTGALMAPDGMTFDINLVCTGKQVGQETVCFGEGNQIVKQFSIQVIE